MTEQEFLTKLEQDKLCDDLAVQLKRETLPLVLWGTGDVAESVVDYLTGKGVSIDACWSDGEEQSRDFHGMKIRSRQEIVEAYSQFNVLMGHAGYDQGKELQKQQPQVQKVFYPFSIHYEQYDKVPYADIAAQAGRFIWLCSHLADEKSIDNLLAYLNTKMTGDASYIIDAFDERTNFYRNDVFTVSHDEVLLDIGAYDGDTVQRFLREADNKYREIIAVEPDDKNFLALNEYVSGERLKHVITSKMGAWNARKEMQFKTGNEQISSVDTGDNILDGSEVITIHADRMDDFFEDEDVSIIKINYYEGVLEAIQGCEEILKKSRPKLAIDVGFDIYNVLKLPEYIDSLGLDYEFYLRFNMPMSSTFTLYAKVAE